MLERWERLGERIAPVLWAALLISLPVTSFRPLSRLLGGPMVAPLAMVPMGMLLVVWVAPHLLRQRCLPRLTWPFFAFVWVALLASLAAFFLPIPPYRSHTILTSEFSAWATLGIGGGFYLTTITWLRDEKHLRNALYWLNLSAIVLFTWSAIQGYYVFVRSANPSWLITAQRWISLRGLFPHRLNGLAFEPSWLAHVLNMAYFPWWIAAVTRRQSVYRWRLGPILAEDLLLAVGLLVLLYSFSRIGLISVLLMTGYLSLRLNLWLGERIHVWLRRRLPAGRVVSIMLGGGLFFAFLLFYAAVLYTLIRFGARYDVRIAAMFEITAADFTSPWNLVNRLFFAERMVYWVAALRVFGRFPWLGVGLGNVGYFLPQTLPDFGWWLPEVNDVLLRFAFLPNAKNLWVRLLAETGVMGWTAVLVWVWGLWRAARSLERKTPVSPLINLLGLGGQLMLIAWFSEGFSLDTFGLPYYWLGLGILTAAVAVGAQEESFS